MSNKDRFSWRPFPNVDLNRPAKRKDSFHDLRGAVVGLLEEVR